MELISSGFALIGLVFLGILLTISILFLITQQNTFKAISPENRLMPPGNVWLQLIPLFNFYWVFVVVNKLSESISLEYSRLNIPDSEQYPTRGIGLTTAIVYFVALIPVELIKGLASLAWMVCFIIYWVKIYQCKNKIIANRGNDLLDIERELLKKETL
ncbi:MAG: hypothetical protein K2X48_16710 [Chitinophagaceae bacterium]|nr:hypothetical protein [Chitinophagaceae bacterium]